MIHDTFWLTASDHSRLFVNQWLPATPLKAVILLAHGMAEHSGRYGRLAEKLCEQGTVSAHRTCVDMAKLPKTGHWAISLMTMAGARSSATWPASTSTSASSTPGCRLCCLATAWAAT